MAEMLFVKNSQDLEECVKRAMDQRIRGGLLRVKKMNGVTMNDKVTKGRFPVDAEGQREVRRVRFKIKEIQERDLIVVNFKGEKEIMMTERIEIRKTVSPLCQRTAWVEKNECWSCYSSRSKIIDEGIL